jgi:perosamine synthetase
MVEAKRRIFEWYEEGLQSVRHLRLCREPAGARSIYWMTSAILEEAAPLKREQFISALKQRNIDTRPVFPAISQYPIWPKKQAPMPNAKLVGDNAVNLPSGVCLRKDDVKYVCRSIREIFSVE